MRRPSFRLALAALLAVAGTACAGRDAAPPPPPPPPAGEFLLAAGDSTFWVATDSAGVHVRGAPMLLARWDGRFYEIYSADDDRSFYDAVFVGQRIFRRDLVTGDSTVVFEDSLVDRAARRWTRAHPTEAPLRANEEGSESPAASVTSEARLLDVFGPFLGFEYRSEVDGDDPAPIVTERAVVDLRTGERVGLVALFGAREAERLVAAGRRAFAATIDSIRGAPGARHDEAARRAVESLGSLVFDEGSFALEAEGRAPAVAFLVPGRGAAEGVALPLPRIAAGTVPAWWHAADSTLPVPASDGSADRWRGARYEIVARYDTSEMTAVSLRDASAHEWTVGRLPAPARRVWWLDAPPVDSTVRHALVRAFDESAMYSEDARVAAWKGGAGPRATGIRVVPVRSEGASARRLPTGRRSRRGGRPPARCRLPVARCR